jgi:Class II Aldolase and Adducin N-terminal domain
VQALANVSLAYVPGEGVWFTTLERGSYLVRDAREVVERLEPLATSRLVIDNEFRTDLEPELWSGDEITESIADAGRRLDALGLLPAPFPVEDLVDEHDLRHIKRLYGIGGLSYGNLSARKDETRFWMSASGVDKAKLETPGRDILLVSGYDAEAARIVLSVPPGIEPRRVSVDAIEHWRIYREHPGVGAILHVHAWLKGIPATEVNFPCGTEELAATVAELLAAEPDPDHAAEPRHHRHRSHARGDPRPGLAPALGARPDELTPSGGVSTLRSNTCSTRPLARRNTRGADRQTAGDLDVRRRVRRRPRLSAHGARDRRGGRARLPLDGACAPGQPRAGGPPPP